MKLLLNALTKFICGLLLVGLLIFLPAGTFNYIGGQVFICLLFVPIFIMGIVLLLKAPNLLKKRLESREKENTQKGVVAFSALIFLGGFIVEVLIFALAGPMYQRLLQLSHRYYSLLHTGFMLR